MVIYRFTDQTQMRTIEAEIGDLHIKIKNLIPQLIPSLRLLAKDSRGNDVNYRLAYNGRLLNNEESLASAGIPPGETIEVIGHDIILG